MNVRERKKEKKRTGTKGAGGETGRDGALVHQGVEFGANAGRSARGRSRQGKAAACTENCVAWNRASAHSRSLCHALPRLVPLLCRSSSPSSSAKGGQPSLEPVHRPRRHGHCRRDRVEHKQHVRSACAPPPTHTAVHLTPLAARTFHPQVPQGRGPLQRLVHLGLRLCKQYGLELAPCWCHLARVLTAPMRPIPSRRRQVHDAARRAQRRQHQSLLHRSARVLHSGMLYSPSFAAPPPPCPALPCLPCPALTRPCVLFRAPP